ncbi:hypothetical protein B5F40_14535 [Gordonibacter sp. An230]|nr:hypothetical protein B5F40_14535 [Gordonibacter sp. An230]OUO96912.1 hypothetical protein B5F41_00030 [Gordonibacter sp. An232A]
MTQAQKRAVRQDLSHPGSRKRTLHAACRSRGAFRRPGVRRRVPCRHLLPHRLSSVRRCENRMLCEATAEIGNALSSNDAQERMALVEHWRPWHTLRPLRAWSRLADEAKGAAS